MPEDPKATLTELASTTTNTADETRTRLQALLYGIAADNTIHAGALNVAADNLDNAILKANMALVMTDQPATVAQALLDDLDALPLQEPTPRFTTPLRADSTTLPSPRTSQRTNNKAAPPAVPRTRCNNTPGPRRNWRHDSISSHGRP